MISINSIIHIMKKKTKSKKVSKSKPSKSKIKKSKISKSKVSKSKTKKSTRILKYNFKNPYTQDLDFAKRHNQTTIPFRILFNDETDPTGTLYDIIIDNIYNKYYYKKDYRDNHTLYSPDEFVEMIELHKNEIIPELSMDEIENLAFLTKAIRKIPETILIIMPPELD